MFIAHGSLLASNHLHKDGLMGFSGGLYHPLLQAAVKNCSTGGMLCMTFALHAPKHDFHSLGLMAGSLESAQ